MKARQVRVTLHGGPRHGHVFWMERPKADAVLLRVVGDPQLPNGVARYAFEPFSFADLDIMAKFVCFMDLPPVPKMDAG